MQISQRMQTGGPAGHLAYAQWYEAEDVLCSSSGIRIGMVSSHSDQFPLKARRVMGRAARRAFSPEHLLPATIFGPRCGEGHVFILAHGVWDLRLLE